MSDRIGYSARRKTREEQRARGSGSDCEREINSRRERSEELCMHRNGFRCKCVGKETADCSYKLLSFSPISSSSLSSSISFGLTVQSGVYSFREMSSVPLIDLISFRVSAFDRVKERERLRGGKKKKKKSRRILESLADINYGPIIPRSRKSGSRLANGEHLAHEGSPLTSIAKKLINRKRCQERQRENEGEGESSRILIELYRVLKERRCETERYILPV